MALGAVLVLNPSLLNLSSGLETVLRYYVGVLAATILIIATNAGLIGISRLSWSLAEHRQLPRVFARLSSRFGTPSFTIVFFSIIAAILVIPGETDFLGNLYSFGAMLSFTIAHVSVVALRVRRPDIERPYRMPWNVQIRGSVIPPTAVLGALGTFAAWISVVVLHDEARLVGIPWMLLGLGGYFLYRRRAGLHPLTRYKIEHPGRPPHFRGLAYRSALVPIFGTDISARAIRSAARLVGQDAQVEAVYVLHVPSQLSLHAGMELRSRRGRASWKAHGSRGAKRG